LASTPAFLSEVFLRPYSQITGQYPDYNTIVSFNILSNKSFNKDYTDFWDITPCSPLKAN
jgi:hypothetical protein